MLHPSEKALRSVPLTGGIAGFIVFFLVYSINGNQCRSMAVPIVQAIVMRTGNTVTIALCVVGPPVAFTVPAFSLMTAAVQVWNLVSHAARQQCADGKQHNE